MLPLLFTATTAWFTTLRLRTYLQPYQQEEYDTPRFARWWMEKRAFDHLASLGLLIAAPFALLQPLAPTLTAVFWLIYRGRQEPNPTVTGKKTLVLTPRATQTWYLAALLTLPAIGGLALLSGAQQMLLTVLYLQTLPLFLALANLLLSPLQAYRNRRYLAEAHAILTRLNPTTVAITGSFGKTSTKYILNHILAGQAPTLATPGSVNTPLGIARVVREQLQSHHQYFIAEMGAYGPGSIARLCKLAPPSISCITAIGHAHYERFKSLETVAQAKFEIAEATISRGGLCILNIDGIPHPLWHPRVTAKPGSYRLVSSNSEHLRDTDYLIESTTQTPTGLTLALRHKNVSTTFIAPIFGQVQAGNLAVAFALAHELQLKPTAINAAMASVKSAPHRLNVQHNGTQTIIDDSYNANPAGFATALETLTLIAHANPEKPRRRILVTPGMVELGTAHDEQHQALGRLAAQHADVILAIHPARIPTFTEAVRSQATPLHTFPTLAAARLWMQANGLPDDVILIANDLPDRYEARWTL